MALSSVCEDSEVDRVADGVHVLWELVKDGFGNHAHLTPSIVFDADRDVSNVYSFN